jgi:hypothetical protein
VAPFEKDLGQLVVQAPAAREALLPLLDPATLAHPAVRAIVAALRDHPAIAPADLGPRLADDAARGLLARWLVEERDWLEPAAIVADMQRRLERRQGHRRIREMTQAIARSEADGAPDLAELQAALREEARRVRAGGVTPEPSTRLNPTTEDARP